MIVQQDADLPVATGRVVGQRREGVARRRGVRHEHGDWRPVHLDHRPQAQHRIRQQADHLGVADRVAAEQPHAVHRQQGVQRLVGILRGEPPGKQVGVARAELLQADQVGVERGDGVHHARRIGPDRERVIGRHAQRGAGASAGLRCERVRQDQRAIQREEGDQGRNLERDQRPAIRREQGERRRRERAERPPGHEVVREGHPCPALAGQQAGDQIGGDAQAVQQDGGLDERPDRAERAGEQFKLGDSHEPLPGVSSS